MKEKGIWFIDEQGNVIYKDQHNWCYDIAKERLNEEDWINHLIDKSWCDMNDFLPVYFEALQKAGHKTITIVTWCNQ